MLRLVDDAALASSAVVANSAMNRERQLAGPNSYTRDLGFNPLDRLLTDREGSVAWLDLCCGQGRALLQAGTEVAARGLADRVTLVGVDLVDYFDPALAGSTVELVCAPLTTWTPDRRFDLITVVHGLHYVGDKLGVLARAASWLDRRPACSSPTWTWPPSAAPTGSRSAALSPPGSGGKVSTYDGQAAPDLSRRRSRG